MTGVKMQGLDRVPRPRMFGFPAAEKPFPSGVMSKQGAECCGGTSPGTLTLSPFRYQTIPLDVRRSAQRMSVSDLERL